MGLTAVVDSSSLIILFKTSLLDKCMDLYTFFISKSVKSEVTIRGYPGWDYFTDLCNKKIIRLLPEISFTGLEDKFSGLDRGEKDTILHYLNGKADFIIIDDGRGADICKKLSLPYINALLVPKILLFKNKILDSEFREYFLDILSVGRYSRYIIDFAENCKSDNLKKVHSLKFFSRDILGPIYFNKNIICNIFQCVAAC